MLTTLAIAACLMEGPMKVSLFTEGAEVPTLSVDLPIIAGMPFLLTFNKEIYMNSGQIGSDEHMRFNLIEKERIWDLRGFK